MINNSLTFITFILGGDNAFIFNGYVHVLTSHYINSLSEKYILQKEKLFQHIFSPLYVYCHHRWQLKSIQKLWAKFNQILDVCDIQPRSMFEIFFLSNIVKFENSKPVRVFNEAE